MSTRPTYPRPEAHLSYDRLWNVLRQRNMRKEDLKEAAQLSSGAIAKLSRGANLQTDTLIRICLALQCDLAEICQVMPEHTVKEH